MIPEEAIEAATFAIYQANSPHAAAFQIGDYRPDAIAALKAAGPILMSQAWDEGYETYSRDEEDSYWGPRAVTRPNPYRSQA